MTRFRTLGSFLGRRCLGLFVVGQLFALLLAGVEYCIAVLLIVFLASVKLVPSPQIPSWVPLPVAHLSPTFVWGAFLLVALLQAGFQIAVYQTKILFTERAHARMRTLLGHLMLRSSRPGRPSLSEANHLTAEVFPKATSSLFYLSQLTSFLLKALAMSVILFLLLAKATLIGIGGLAVMGCAVLLLNRKTNRLSAEVPSAQERLERSKVRITANRLLIRVLRMERRELGVYLDSVDTYYRHSVRAYFWGNLGGAVLPVFGVVLIATIVLTGLGLFHTQAASLVAFLYLFLRFEQTVANGSNLVGGLFAFRHQFARMVRLVSSLPDAELRGALAQPAPDLAAATRNSGRALEPPSIEIRDLSFAWTADAPPLFCGVSHFMEAGSQAAILGPNGSGKSTLLSILLGALEPHGGEVRIGGMSASEWVTRHSDSVAFVGPEPYLVQGSIRDNLAYGLRAGWREEELMRAICEAGLGRFVEALPAGLDHLLLENGDGLSTGQRQRLSIARAFLRAPRLLVLDEPFANLDRASARELASRVASMKRSCTVVLVSHDPGMLGRADSRLDLDAFHRRAPAAAALAQGRPAT